jgi:hypothetical protein
MKGPVGLQQLGQRCGRPSGDARSTMGLPWHTPRPWDSRPPGAGPMPYLREYEETPAANTKSGCSPDRFTSRPMAVFGRRQRPDGCLAHAGISAAIRQPPAMILDVGVAVIVLHPAAGQQLAQTLMQAVGGNPRAATERESAADHSFGDPAEVADSPQLIEQCSLVQRPAARARPLDRPVMDGCGRPSSGEIVNVGELDCGPLSWVTAAHRPVVPRARRYSCSRHPGCGRDPAPRTEAERERRSRHSEIQHHRRRGSTLRPATVRRVARVLVRHYGRGSLWAAVLVARALPHRLE